MSGLLAINHKNRVCYCACCRQMFHPNSPANLYCSDDCRQRKSRQDKKKMDREIGKQGFPPKLSPQEVAQRKMFAENCALAQWLRDEFGLKRVLP